MFKTIGSLITKVRTGNIDSPYLSIEESLTIDNNAKVHLKEIPDNFEKVVVSGEGVSWYEINNGSIGEDQFKVDYTNRTVTFNTSNIGKQLEFKYKGMGITLAPLDSIYTEIGEDGVVKTLKDLGDSANLVDGALQGILEELPQNKLTNERIDEANVLISQKAQKTYVDSLKSDTDAQLAQRPTYSELPSGAFTYKGTVAGIDNLPTTGNTIGDQYRVSSLSTNYAWSGYSWNDIGAFELDDGSVTVNKFHPDIKSQLEALLASIKTEGQVWEGN